RKDPHFIAPGNASLIKDWREDVEERAREGFRSLCASRYLFKITTVPFRAAVGRPPIGGRVGWVVPLTLQPIFLTACWPGLERVKLITTS
ncbi:hypothetical protein A4A49_60289, partial [Nicotiana attenuata]